MNTIRLADILDQEKEALLTLWRQQVRELPAAKDQSDPTLNDHVPHLLEDLIGALRADSSETIPEALESKTGAIHGLQRLAENYDIEEVVAEYNILRGCIHDLATRSEIDLQGAPFHILNRVLDSSIGLAVKTYATEQALRVKKQRDEHLSFIVHDLRTPLNAIAMAGKLLEKRTRSGAQGSEDFLSILVLLQANVATLTALVAQILEENVALMTEADTKVEHRLFGLWGLLEGVIQDLSPTKETGKCELVNLVPYDVSVYGDAGLLSRVFRNLIANAIKYTPEGSIEVGAVRCGDDGAVECWVKDTGLGIPEPRLANIFEKLETDPTRDDGIGLGLAIVAKFIKAHEGKVSVESEEGVGSTFRIFLPGKRKS